MAFLCDCAKMAFLCTIIVLPDLVALTEAFAPGFNLLVYVIFMGSGGCRSLSVTMCLAFAREWCTVGGGVSKGGNLPAALCGVDGVRMSSASWNSEETLDAVSSKAKAPFPMSGFGLFFEVLVGCDRLCLSPTGAKDAGDSVGSSNEGKSGTAGNGSETKGSVSEV
jgi:hypothetical protein